MYLPFVNRERELKEVTQDIADYRGRNRAYMISSISGIGKSTFCKKVLESVNDRPSIKLSLLPSRMKFQQEGFYLRELCILIDELSIDNPSIPSFSKFWQLNASVDIAQDMSDFLLKELSKSNVITKAVKHFYDSVKQRTHFSARSMLEISGSPIISASIDYLGYVFSQVELLINIENIQGIDPESLNALSHVLQKNTGQYLLLEYTEGDNALWSINDVLSEFLSKQVPIDNHDLEKLSVSDILKLYDTHPEAILALIEQLYVESNGSLTALRHYSLKFSNNHPQAVAYLESLSTSNLNQVSVDYVSDLSDDEKSTLVLISVHGDWVSNDLVKRFEIYIENSKPLFDFDIQVQLLAQKELLQVDHQLGRVRCDEKVSVLLERDDFKIYNTIAIDFWLSTYVEILNNSSEQLISKSEIYYFLIYFNMLNGSIENSLGLIDEISYLALTSYSPSRLIEILTNIKHKLQSIKNYRFHERVCRRLIDIYTSLSYTDSALELVEELEDSPEKYVYKGSLLEATGQADRALPVANEIRSKYSDYGEQYRASADLIEFVALRALERMGDCKHLFYKMESEASYKDLFEYGFILRSAASALTAEECIPFVERSIQHFNQRNAHIQEGFSRIELSVAYAVCRDYKSAMQALDKCSSLLSNRISEKHTVYNNKACLKMLIGDSFEDAYLLLKQARTTLTLGFDRLAVANNTFIALSFVNPVLAEVSIDRLLQLIEAGGFQSKYIVRKVYYNIGVHYHFMGEHGKSKEYFAQMASIDTIVRHKNTHKSDFKYDIYGHDIGGKPFSPIFMAHWNMEFNNFSELFLEAS